MTKQGHLFGHNFKNESLEAAAKCTYSKYATFDKFRLEDSFVACWTYRSVYKMKDLNLVCDTGVIENNAWYK